jgi:protein phosphatase
MSTDHKPNRPDEAERIRNAGGFVFNNRVMGELAVSRAFGDCALKLGFTPSLIEQAGLTVDNPEEVKNWDQPLIIAEPDIEVTTVTDHDQFFLLACDGLFDVFTPEDVIAFVRSNMEEHGDTQRCCQNLTFEAIRKRNSRDNVSVILIILNKWW